MQRGGRATKRVMVCHLMIMKNTGVLGDSEVNSSHYNTLEQSKTKDPNIKAGKLSPKEVIPIFLGSVVTPRLEEEHPK